MRFKASSLTDVGEYSRPGGPFRDGREGFIAGVPFREFALKLSVDVRFLYTDVVVVLEAEVKRDFVSCAACTYVSLHNGDGLGSSIARHREGE